MAGVLAVEGCNVTTQSYREKGSIARSEVWEPDRPALDQQDHARRKKATAEGIVYDAMEVMESRLKKPALEILELGVRNATPLIEVRPRPRSWRDLPGPDGDARERPAHELWRCVGLIQSARKRSGKTMAEKLAGELMDASQNQGATVKKKEDTHKMAEANRAFAHYRW